MFYEFPFSRLPVEFKEICLKLKISNLNIQSILIHKFHISEFTFSLKFVYNTKIILAMLSQSSTYAEHKHVCSQSRSSETVCFQQTSAVYLVPWFAHCCAFC